MSRTVATFIGVVSMVILLHAFRAMHESSIVGKIVSAKDVWVYAVNGKDSIKTIARNGKFRLSVKPGSWKVLIAKRNELKDQGNINVLEGKTLDLGTIE